MTGPEYPSRLRGARGALLLCVLGLLAFPLLVALLLIGLAGIALLVAGLLSWLHPTDVAAAWARTLMGLGLIGASAASLASARLAIGALFHWETVMSRRLKFAAVLGGLMALICLPFGAAIGANTHVSWLGWADGSGDVRPHSHPAQLDTNVHGSGRISEVPGVPAAAAPPESGSGA